MRNLRVDSAVQQCGQGEAGGFEVIVGPQFGSAI